MNRFIIAIIFISFLLSGCAALQLTGKAVGSAGKLAYGTVKTTAKVTGKAGYVAYKIAGKSIKTVVNMATGKTVVDLAKKGNSFYVNTRLNRRVRTDLILDTGCSETQISSQTAKKIGINTSKSQKTLCRLADGRMVRGSVVNIKEVQIGRARVRNVKAIVLDGVGTEREPGLLGMSFLNNFVFKIDPEKNILVLHRR